MQSKTTGINTDHPDFILKFLHFLNIELQQEEYLVSYISKHKNNHFKNLTDLLDLNHAPINSKLIPIFKQLLVNLHQGSSSADIEDGQGLLIFLLNNLVDDSASLLRQESLVQLFSKEEILKTKAISLILSKKLDQFINLSTTAIATSNIELLLGTSGILQHFKSQTTIPKHLQINMNIWLSAINSSLILLQTQNNNEITQYMLTSVEHLNQLVQVSRNHPAFNSVKAIDGLFQALLLNNRLSSKVENLNQSMMNIIYLIDPNYKNIVTALEYLAEKTLSQQAIASLITDLLAQKALNEPNKNDAEKLFSKLKHSPTVVLIIKQQIILILHDLLRNNQLAMVDLVTLGIAKIKPIIQFLSLEQDEGIRLKALSLFHTWLLNTHENLVHHADGHIKISLSDADLTIFVGILSSKNNEILRVIIDIMGLLFQKEPKYYAKFQDVTDIKGILEGIKTETKDGIIKYTIANILNLQQNHNKKNPYYSIFHQPETKDGEEHVEHFPITFN